MLAEQRYAPVSQRRGLGVEALIGPHVETYLWRQLCGIGGMQETTGYNLQPSKLRQR